MALVAGTLYQCLETHQVKVGNAFVVVQKGELRLGAAPEATAETLWIAAGSSEAQKVTARVAAGLPPTG
jgi:hypothetical protein